MAKKLGKNEYPSGHSASDFDCFGPVATKDGEFNGFKLADMGCFKQDKVDSNKFYHLCVCKSKIDSGWYTYFEWGRVGKSTTFQFTECTSESEAQDVFEKQAHTKNDKRGKWDTIAGMKVLVPKPGKDVYLVQANDSRSWGLTDARGIATEGTTVKKTVKTAAKKSTTKKAPTIQREVASLLRDINVATVQYTRTQIKGDYLPSQVAINEARDILVAAMRRIMVVGHNTDDQIADNQIKLLTNTLYSRIPKEKKLRAAPQDWILSQDNVGLWNLDLDTFESALGAAEVIEHKDDSGVDPYGGMPITMEWMGSSKNPITPMAEWLTKWMPKASKDVHSYLGKVSLKNVWHINRKGSHEKLVGEQRAIAKSKISIGKERPLFQVKARPDLNKVEQQAYYETNTALLFHGTRSVNVRGILESSLRLPRQLVGVTTNGAMFGPGLYFADDFKKSIGYTSHGGGIYSGGSGGMRTRSPFMFLADVVLGKAHVAVSSKGWTKAPQGTHSVFGKGGKTKSWGGKLLNNEFIVYKTPQHNLRYLVEFDC